MLTFSSHSLPYTPQHTQSSMTEDENSSWWGGFCCCCLGAEGQRCFLLVVCGFFGYFSTELIANAVA